MNFYELSNRQTDLDILTIWSPENIFGIVDEQLASDIDFSVVDDWESSSVRDGWSVRVPLSVYILDTHVTLDRSRDFSSEFDYLTRAITRVQTQRDLILAEENRIMAKLKEESYVRKRFLGIK